MPGLLVSVKNREEAVAAINGKTDILDLKAPERGSLGMASTETMQEVLEQSHSFPAIKTSAALGELEEWNLPREVPECLDQFDYLKVGPGDTKSLDHWFDSLLNLISHFRNVGIVLPKWIAVLYADKKPGNQLFDSKKSSIEELSSKLKENHFAGLLIDTANKKEGSLVSFFNDTQLQKIVTAVQSKKMLCSLAGRLNFEEIESLLKNSVFPNYYAVRSAVCLAENRKAEVQQQQVKELKQLLQNSLPLHH